jgi:hypothetical protein
VWSTWIAGECVFQDAGSPHPTVKQIQNWSILSLLICNS